MRGFFTLASAATAVALWVVGCSSSSDSGTPSTGGSGGSASNVQCVGSYSDLTESAFSAALSSTGSCIGASDATTICTNDVTKAAATCGASCYAMDTSASAAAQDACTTTCLNSTVTPAPSADCVSCYIADVGCARAHCLVICGGAPTSQACATCRAQNGCVDPFYSCSGLPRPTSSSGGSGGSGGGPAANAGAGG